jgi:HPt (histidine-containing phosphotransfer) domain-containing protein
MQQVNAVPFDREEMLERLDGDTELLTDVLGVFLEECPRMMQEIRAAVDRGDSVSVRRTAHSIKGALLNISAAPAAAEASQLEQLGVDERLVETAEVLDQLQSEIDRLEPLLVAQTEAQS